MRLVDDLKGDGQSDMGLAGDQVGDGHIDKGFIKVGGCRRWTSRYGVSCGQVRDEQVDVGLVCRQLEV